MLGLFSRRPRPDAEAVARLKVWVADLMALGDRDPYRYRRACLP
jgi:hypothetical protein